MSDKNYSKDAEQAISFILDAMEPQAKLAKDIDRVMNDVAQWTELPDDFPEADLVTFLVAYNMGVEAFQNLEDSLLASVNERTRDMSQNEPGKYYALEAKIRKKLTTPPLEVGQLYLETSIVHPEGSDDDTHLLVAVPVVMKQDFSLMVPKKLSQGLSIGLYVTPNAEANVSGEFNIKAHYTPAGYEIEPYVMPYKPLTEGGKSLHIVSHRELPDGTVSEPVHKVRPFTI